jgi:hypothetical protein
VAGESYVCKQGDQIGRIFAHWVTFFSLGKRIQMWPTFLVYFFYMLRWCFDFTKKMCWATFWAIFSSTHLDSLFVDRPFTCCFWKMERYSSHSWKNLILIDAEDETHCAS